MRIPTSYNCRVDACAACFLFFFPTWNSRMHRPLFVNRADKLPQSINKSKRTRFSPTPSFCSSNCTQCHYYYGLFHSYLDTIMAAGRPHYAGAVGAWTHDERTGLYSMLFTDVVACVGWLVFCRKQVVCLPTCPMVFLAHGTERRCEKVA